MTKSNIVNDAFTELGLSGYVYNLQPEDLQTALTMLESLVARLDVAGIELNWPFAASLNDVAGNVTVDLPFWAHSGLVALLAIDLSAGFGKTVAASTSLKAKLGYETMVSVSAIPNPIAKNHMVGLGSGNKPWRMWRVFVMPDLSRRVTVSSESIQPDIGAKIE